MAGNVAYSDIPAGFQIGGQKQPQYSDIPEGFMVGGTQSKPDTSFVSNYGQSFINAANEGRIGLEGLGQSVGKALYGANPQDASEQASRQAELDKIRSETAQSGIQPSGMAGTLGSLAGGIAGNPTSWTPLGKISGIGDLAKAGAKIGALSGVIQNTNDNSIENHLLNAGVGAGEGALASAALGKAGSIATSIPAGVVNRVKGAFADSAEDMAAQSEKNWEDAGNLFKSSAGNGAIINNNSAQGILSKIRTAIGNLTSRHSDTANTLSDFETTLQKGNVSPSDLHDFRKYLNDVVKENTKSKIDGGGINEDGQKAMAAKNALDEALSGLTAKDLSAGTPQAISDLQNGINSTARAYRYDRVANMLKDSGGDPNAIMRGAAKILKNANGYSPEEIDALNDLATRGTGQAIERALGTFGFDLGKAKNIALPAITSGAGAVVPGGIPLTAVGTVARQTGKWAAKGKGQNLLDTIMERDTAPPAPTKPWSSQLPANMQGYGPNQSPVLALPAPKVTNYVNSAGQNVPLSEAGRETLGQSPSTAAERQPAAGINAAQQAREKFASGFAQKEAESAVTKKMQEDKLWHQNNIPPEQLISEAAQRFKDAGLPVGEVGNALMRFLNDQQGSMPLPKFIDLMNAVKAFNPEKLAAIAPAGIVAGSASQKPATGNIGEQNMQELQKLKTPAVTTPQASQQSNAAPNVQKFAQAESSNNPNAKNPNSSASGLYQFTDGTWAQMVNKYGKDTGITLKDKNNPQAQQVMAKLYAQDNIKQLQPVLGRMPTLPEVYMAHVFGANGAARLINAQGTGKQAVMILPNAANANRQIFFNGNQPRTVEQVYQLLASKV